MSALITIIGVIESVVAANDAGTRKSTICVRTDGGDQVYLPVIDTAVADKLLTMGSERPVVLTVSWPSNERNVLSDTPA